MQLTWADKMKEEGHRKGLVEGKRATLIQLLSLKFDTVPDATRARVQSLSLDELDTYLERVLSVETLEEPEPDIEEPDLGLPTLTLAALQEVGGGVLHVHGQAQPGSTVTVDGHEVSVRPDGSFSEYVKRTDRAEVMVQATAPDGQFAEQARSVPRRQ